MIHTLKSLGGMMVAPHHLAAQAGRDVLRQGGNAVEAMVAAAATIAVVYPHMNSIGGDGFWLIHEPGKPPVAIDACGPAAALATPEFYAGHDVLPSRGPQAALTVAGTLGGWIRALELSAEWGGRASLPQLLSEAIRHAENGVVVSTSQAGLTRQKLEGLKNCPGFADTYLVNGHPPAPGHVLKQPALAQTFRHLAEHGLDDFYRGALARSLCRTTGPVGWSPCMSGSQTARCITCRRRRRVCPR